MVFVHQGSLVGFRTRLLIRSNFCIYFFSFKLPRPVLVDGWYKLSHTAEGGVNVLFGWPLKLSLCRTDLGSFHQNCTPDVVWLGSLRDYPDNICILLIRILCGHRRLRSRDQGIVSFRSQLRLTRHIRNLAVPCRPYIPLHVFLSVLGLRGSSRC